MTETNELTPEQILDYIDRLMEDDFVEDFFCLVGISLANATDEERERFFRKTPVKDLHRYFTKCDQILSDIYTTVHGYNPRHECYRSHANWRAEAAKNYEKLKEENS